MNPFDLKAVLAKHAQHLVINPYMGQQVVEFIDDSILLREE